MLARDTHSRSEALCLEHNFIAATTPAAAATAAQPGIVPESAVSAGSAGILVSACYPVEGAQSRIVGEQLTSSFSQGMAKGRCRARESRRRLLSIAA